MGTAIIIDGADFSANNIGKVTIKRDIVDEIVTRYIAKSGNGTYREAIKTMTQSLVDSGLWEKTVCFYPMLGSTLDAMSVNLASENEYPLHFLENATADNNKVYFSNTTEVSNPKDVKTWSIKKNIQNNIGLVLRCKRSSSETNNTGRWFSIGSAYFGTVLSDEKFRTVQGGFLGSRLMSTNVFCEDVKTYIYLNEATRCTWYANGEEVNKNEVSENTVNVYFAGVIGATESYTPTLKPGETVSANINLAGGEISLLVYGDYAPSDVAQLNAIIDAFVSAVGK